MSRWTLKLSPWNRETAIAWLDKAIGNGGGGEWWSMVITDSRTTSGTGVDTLTNVEYLKFDNLTYDHINHRANYVPTDVTENGCITGARD